MDRNITQHIISEAIAAALIERADTVVCNNKTLINSTSGAFPFFYDKTAGEVTVGDECEKHYDAVERGAFVIPDNDNTMGGLETAADFDNIILGRYWSKENVIGFWGIQPSADILRRIVHQLSKQGLNIDTDALQVVVDSEETHREGWINTDHYLVPYANYLQGNLESTYQDSDEFKRQYTLHLSDMETKRHDMGNYLKRRSQNLGKKLGTSNKGEISQAEWNALHRTSESKSYRSRLI